MDLAKEIELIILSRIAREGKVTDKDFDQLFQNNNLEYNPALIRTIEEHCKQLTEISGEYGELRRKALVREKNIEETAGKIKGRFIKHYAIIHTGTRFLVIVSLVTVMAAFLLIHLESKNHSLQSPKIRAIPTR